MLTLLARLDAMDIVQPDMAGQNVLLYGHLCCDDNSSNRSSDSDDDQSDTDTAKPLKDEYLLRALVRSAHLEGQPVIPLGPTYFPVLLVPINKIRSAKLLVDRTCTHSWIRQSLVSLFPPPDGERLRIELNYSPSSDQPTTCKADPLPLHYNALIAQPGAHPLFDLADDLDGILGADFLDEYDAALHFNMLTFKANEKVFEQPIAFGIFVPTETIAA